MRISELRPQLQSKPLIKHENELCSSYLLFFTLNYKTKWKLLQNSALFFFISPAQKSWECRGSCLQIWTFEISHEGKF